ASPATFGSELHLGAPRCYEVHVGAEQRKVTCDLSSLVTLNWLADGVGGIVHEFVSQRPQRREGALVLVADQFPCTKIVDDFPGFGRSNVLLVLDHPVPPEGGLDDEP